MAKDSPRAKRLAGEIRRVLTDALRRRVKDTRIGNVTITDVEVAADLRSAKIYYLIFGRQGADPQVQLGLESAAGFLRGALSKALSIRQAPSLSFELDEAFERGMRLSRLIDEANESSGDRDPDSPDAPDTTDAEP